MSGIPALADLLPIDRTRFAASLAAAKARLASAPTSSPPSLLPPNATLRQLALEAGAALIANIPTPIASVWNPDTCPAALLPYLAWGLSIDVWSPDWPETVKRERIRRAITIQRQKGTAQSVRAVVESFGGSITIREWWQQDPPEAPFTFAAVLDLGGWGDAAPTGALVDQVIEDITRTKPVRSHFAFTLAVSSRGRLGAVGVARPVIYQRLSLVSVARTVLLSPLKSRVLISPLTGRIMLRAF